jgi:hypothetical protein
VSYSHEKLYDEPNTFFEIDGVTSMQLTGQAAQDVCRMALKFGLLINRIEGGIWRNPSFESRLDCIWDGVDPPVSVELAQDNNRKAQEFVRSAAPFHTSYIITAVPLSGWWHKGHRPTPIR